jgi:hypothetical protein
MLVTDKPTYLEKQRGLIYSSLLEKATFLWPDASSVSHWRRRGRRLCNPSSIRVGYVYFKYSQGTLSFFSTIFFLHYNENITLLR